MSRGDELISALRDGSAGEEWPSIAQELLRELYAGFPVDRLIPLVRSDTPAAARSAAWLLSELGTRAEPLIGEAARLLGDPARYVRFFAVDAVLAAAGDEQAPVIARAIGLAGDPDEAIRRKVLVLLSRMDGGRLTASLPHLSDPVLRELTSGLIAGRPPAEIRTALADTDPMRRRFAAAAAVRTADLDDGPLRAAIESPDEEIATFAGREQEVRQATRGHHA
jgi:hypothetical protein